MFSPLRHIVGHGKRRWLAPDRQKSSDDKLRFRYMRIELYVTNTRGNPFDGCVVVS